MNRFAPCLLTLRDSLQRRFRISQWQATLLWAIVAGVLGALATELFRLALTAVDGALFGRSSGLVDIARRLPSWARATTPAVGGLLAGSLLVVARRADVRKATSDYMEAIVLGDGRIPPAQTLARSASSLLSIASGGSIGREGSMVQMAALSSSLLGRLLNFPVERLRLLVACGAAAGLTAAYNAPIAGAFFVAEVVLGSIAMESVGPIMVASVVSNIAMRALPGYRPVYEMPTFPGVSGVEVLLFAALGGLLGGAAAALMGSLSAARRLFGRLPVPLPLRLALGGLVMGTISVWVPEVWGNGFSVVTDVLHSPSVGPVLVLVLVAKLVATLATVGSGAVGGVFTPTLFFGCLIGTLYGMAVQALFPGFGSAPFAYGIVGMGALLAGATQAPLMAILMIFEMTLSYQVMLPLMTASVIAYFVARSAGRSSMYEITAKRREQLDERLRLRALHVRDLIQAAETVVEPDAGLQEMSRLFLQYPVKYLYVVDGRSHFLGVVPLKSLSAATGTADLSRQCAADLQTRDIAPLTAGMNLGEALQRFMEHRGERLPVIESIDQPVLLGAVAKSALLAAYVRLSE